MSALRGEAEIFRSLRALPIATQSRLRWMGRDLTIALKITHPLVAPACSCYLSHVREGWT
jgi:hypothetical protein